MSAYAIVNLPAQRLEVAPFLGDTCERERHSSTPTNQAVDDGAADTA